MDYDQWKTQSPDRYDDDTVICFYCGEPVDGETEEEVQIGDQFGYRPVCDICPKCDVCNCRCKCAAEAHYGEPIPY